MIVRTKKYALPSGTYIRLALGNVLRQQWWVILIVLAIMSGSFILNTHWFITGALIAYVLYILFWLIQFAGVTQAEQSKFLFEKLSYEVGSHQIMVKLNTKQGMPLKWDQIKRAKKTKDAFILTINKAQLIHLPFKVFKTENEIKFIETILKRKGYIK